MPAVRLSRSTFEGATRKAPRTFSESKGAAWAVVMDAEGMRHQNHRLFCRFHALYEGIHPIALRASAITGSQMRLAWRALPASGFANAPAGIHEAAGMRMEASAVFMAQASPKTRAKIVSTCLKW